MDEERASAEEARLQEILRNNDWMPAYKQSSLPLQEYCEFSDHPWKLPGNCSITAKGRRIVSVDPNISQNTLSALLRSEASYFTKPEYAHFLTDSAREIITSEFEQGRMSGYAHLSQCIRSNMNKTMADLIAEYSGDRRIPFIVGAVLINALMQEGPLYYYKYVRDYVQDNGYKRINWEPRKIYIKPQTVYPLAKRDRKKYYAAPKTKPAEPENCPACGSKTKILRVGYRGRKYHVCCTKQDCQWFLGDNPKNTEAEALAGWAALCAAIREQKEGGESENGSTS